MNRRGIPLALLLALGLLSLPLIVLGRAGARPNGSMSAGRPGPQVRPIDPYADILAGNRLRPGAEGAAGPVGAPQTGPGTVIVVTTQIPDINPDGQCALIEALENANADAATHADCPAGAGPDTVQLAPNGLYDLTQVHNTTNGPNGLPVINSDITIQGQGATIGRSQLPATPSFRLLHIAAGGVLTLNDLTLTGGAERSGLGGGGLYNRGGTVTLNGTVVANNLAVDGDGGGIRNQDGLLTLNESTIQANQVVEENAAVTGGGLENAALNQDATVVLNHSAILSNTATGLGASGGGGGVVSFFAAGLRATITLNHSAISGNLADLGGGLWITSLGSFSGESLLVLHHSAVDGNRTTDARGSGWAGGILLVGTMTATHSTISHNTADGSQEMGSARGGGIYALDSQVLLVNSTVSGNRSLGANASSGQGGGIANRSIFGQGSVFSLVNSTISANSSTVSGGGLASDATTQTAANRFSNSIIAGNSSGAGDNCTFGAGATVGSAGHNLEDGDSCGLDQISDLILSQPMLGPLQDNGGATWTHALLDASPALDAADDGVCAAAPVNGLDQRGVSRPVGPRCDIGAYESDATPATADIALSKAVGPNPVTVGSELRYTFTVTNAGPGPAHGVVLTDAVPISVTFAAATTSQGDCFETGGLLACRLGTITATGRVTAMVTAIPVVLGALNNVATASTTSVEGNLADNQASAGTFVLRQLTYLPVISKP